MKSIPECKLKEINLNNSIRVLWLLIMVIDDSWLWNSDPLDWWVHVPSLPSNWNVSEGAQVAGIEQILLLIISSISSLIIHYFVAAWSFIVINELVNHLLWVLFLDM